MGGVLILLGIAVSTLLWADLTNRFVWIVMLVTFGYGVIGWVDDYRKVVHKDPRGMSSREKYFWQSVIGLVAAVYLAFSVSEANNARVFDLFMAWVRSGLRRWACRRGRPDAAVRQGDQLSARRVGLHRADVFRDRRREQCGESHRRPRRPRHHAGRAGGRFARRCSPT